MGFQTAFQAALPRAWAFQAARVGRILESDVSPQGEMGFRLP
ncbi:hypothetical protein HMPREF9418_0230 [Neisseria macacae ATCC 33926]|uniref:Uncharacterized protein n=1 Tax=Neisseria macacae ATCC 33926 TaxID=997348 RepID=A0AA36XN76_9NEIS|nr:hypothetical protein HMPREF9418_0230 [Neisseria macacae ATCC 33926]